MFCHTTLVSPVKRLCCIITNVLSITPEQCLPLWRRDYSDAVHVGVLIFASLAKAQWPRICEL